MEPCDDAEPMPPLPLGQRPEPRWVAWTTRFFAYATAFATSIAFLLLIVYLAPTAKSNADAAEKQAAAVRSLAAASAVEKQQDACYDLFTAHVTDGNQAVLASLSEGVGAIGTLVVDLSTPAAQRDPNVVTADVEAIKAASQHSADALAAYNQANAARKAYSAAARPLPCPISE